MFEKLNRHVAVSAHIRWRQVLLSSIAVAFAAFVGSLPPLPQDIGYHNFADTRSLFSLPNFFDVVSNIPFLLVGLAGVAVCFAQPIGTSRIAWLTLFIGVAMIGFGSAWYHWQPTNESLVWDRLPMTIGFMGLLVALLDEYVSKRFAKALLLPALLLGFASVLYWHWFDDLRFYIYVQVAPLLLIPLVMLLFKASYTHQWMLLLALGCYGLAKVAESFDHQLFALTASAISGHSIKHMLAALGCLILVVMIAVREPLRRQPT